MRRSPLWRALPAGLLCLALAGPARPEPAAVSAEPPAAASRAPFGFQSWDSDEPLSIDSEEMEAELSSGARTLVFRKRVHVTQGELSVRCAELEAFYPADSNQPDRLVARGSVQVAQGRQAARCDQMIYDRSREQLVCQGNAHFRDGDNEVAGDLIEIDLSKETVRVKGGASLVIQPETLRGDDGP